jgi:hypothetical protein
VIGWELADDCSLLKRLRRMSRRMGMRGALTVILIVTRPSVRSAVSLSSTPLLKHWGLNGTKNASPAR